jgi:hypothetical protein
MANVTIEWVPPFTMLPLPIYVLAVWTMRWMPLKKQLKFDHEHLVELTPKLQ